MEDTGILYPPEPDTWPGGIPPGHRETHSSRPSRWPGGSSLLHPIGLEESVLSPPTQLGWRGELSLLQPDRVGGESYLSSDPIGLEER